jgi:hypothetical protein
MGEFVEGKTVDLREAVDGDAGFILSLRGDGKLNRLMHPVPQDVARQVAWMQEHRGPGNMYFIIQGKDGTRYGTMRMHDGCAESFWIASWILTSNAPHMAPVESFFRTVDYAFRTYGSPHLLVRITKENTKVMKFYERIQVNFLYEEQTQIIAQLQKNTFRRTFDKYLRKIQ